MTYVLGFFIIFTITLIVMATLAVTILTVIIVGGMIHDKFGSISASVFAVIVVASAVSAIVTGAAVLEQVIPFEEVFK